MEDFQSKYSGEQVENLLDQVASGNTGGGGGGGITVETDPIFSASPASSITEEKITEWDNKYSKPSGGITKSDLAANVQSALIAAESYKGTVIGVKANNATKMPADGIVDLGVVGTYSKPSTGIPKSDLNPSVQTSLGKADTAVQPKDIKDEVYIADFTMESLKSGMNNGSRVDCDMQALITAMNANKLILVREGEDSDYKGVHILNGYTEDLLYFSIVDTMGDILWCEGTEYIDGTPSIDGTSLHLRRWDDKQDTLVSGENIKTINGESIVGSGDITISGGGSSSGGSSAYSEVNHGTSDTTFTLTPNTFHVWDEVASLTLDFGSETSGVANEFLFQFTSGATATTLSLPDDIKWTSGETPIIEANKIYQISILKGLGSVLEWNNAPTLIENKVNVSISGTKYLVSLQYAATSDIVVKVRTGDGPISVNILSGEISKTASPLGPIVDSGAYIEGIAPISDNNYNYTW